MSRTLKLSLLLACAVAISSALSHTLALWLHIETETGKLGTFGTAGASSRAFVAGSSLALDGIAWPRIAGELSQSILMWGVAGSSPWEWQVLQERARDVRVTYLVVSPYDMNEQFLCDFHANVVPLSLTIQQLWQSSVHSHFWKRVLSAYPLKYVRKLFPTAGRSQGVLTGLRSKLQRYLGTADVEGGPVLRLARERGANLKISDWSADRALRRLASMRSACQGSHSFNGPKRLALLRMLRTAGQQGEVVVIVLPVSPLYGGEFLTPEVCAEFEKMVADSKQCNPQARWIRLDELEALKSNDYYSDLVHLNMYGQQIATAALLPELHGLVAKVGSR